MATYAYGALAVDVVANTSKLPAQIEKDSKAAGEKAGKAAGSAWGSGFLELAAVVGAEKLGETVLKAAEQSEVITKATEAVIRSTGGAAHVSAQQIDELGQSIMKKTGVDTEAVRSGENMLLTFRNVRNETGKGNDIFSQATSTLTDMTAALTGATPTAEGLRHQAIQLGKALNDPVAGMGALSRVGVTFTKQQKDQVKAMVAAGNTLGAQKLILAELNKEFGGAAAAYATPMERLHTATHELAVQMGTALLPIVGSVATWMTNVGVPALEAFGHWLAQNKTWVVPLAGALASFVTTLYLLSKAFEVAGAAAKLFGFTLELSLGPVGLIIAGLIAVGVGLYLLWTRSSTFRVIMEQSFRAVQAAWKIMASVLTIGLTALRAYWTVVWSVMAAVVRVQLAVISAVIRIAFNLIVGIITVALDLLTGKWGAAWQAVLNTGRQIANQLVGVWRTLLATASQLWGQIASVVSNSWNSMVSSARSAGGQIINGLKSGMATAISGIGSWVKATIVDPVVNAVKHFFGIKSPSTVMEGIGQNLTAGLFKGLEGSAGGMVKMVFGGWPQALGGLVEKGFAKITALPGKALAALGSVTSKVGGWFSKLFGSGGVGGGVAKWSGLMHQVLGMFGLDNLFGVFMTQMNTESGGNPNAINLWDSNAAAGMPSQGLMQVIPPTFAAYAGPFAGLGILNPLANIYAAVAYAVARYGSSIASVLGHGHGYATGGPILEPVSGIGHRSGDVYHFGERGPEYVVPMNGAGAGGKAVVINVYPRANQSEVEIAAAVSRNLGWAQATGRA